MWKPYKYQWVTPKEEDHPYFGKVGQIVLMNPPDPIRTPAIKIEWANKSTSWEYAWELEPSGR
jgi:hypothetical protein